jgi:tRNA1(Val) A37 N6-methylase TrmN6
MDNKVILELGAGCALPGIVCALHCTPAIVYITDVNEIALKNAVFNVNLNCSSDISSSNNDSSNCYVNNNENETCTSNLTFSLGFFLFLLFYG